jgi:IS4 transposase
MAETLASSLKSGEIATFDKAYIKFKFLYQLTQRGVFWVGRAKKDMQYETIQVNEISKNSKIIRDELIQLTVPKSREQYPEKFRLVEAWIEVNGKDQKMIFISNNLNWAPGSICDLYKSRWAIEVFFKEMKQSLQLADFIGYSENAVKWQVWTALLTYLLVRFISCFGDWKHSFKRLFTVLRALLWHNFNLYDHLQKFYGTASAPCRIRSSPGQAFLPGFS